MSQRFFLGRGSYVRYLGVLLLGAMVSCDHSSENASPTVPQQKSAESVPSGQPGPSMASKARSVSEDPEAKAARSKPFALVDEPGQEVSSHHEVSPSRELIESDSVDQMPAYMRIPRPTLDQAELAAAGIRRIESQHLALYTDLPSTEEVDQLPAIMDAAVPFWCEYFQVEPEQVASWKMIAYLIRDRSLFRRLKLLSEDLPPFQNGYQRGWEIWIYEQPSAYYQRHMLLHEGTHAFMSWQLGGAGPPWYMEGMAELLGTHRWQNGRLELGYFPQHREEVELWGRTRIVQNEMAAGNGMSLDQVMDYGPTAHINNAPYGWCWAAAAFLDGHPEFQAPFRQLRQHVRSDPSLFHQQFQQIFEPHEARLIEQWQLFIRNLDYGYDLEREAIQYREPIQLPVTGATFTVKADRGWQSTGVRVKPGVTYELTARGRYQITQQPEVWWSEPGGVTIQYHEGRPLGVLLAAVRDESTSRDGLTGLARPAEIGLERSIMFPEPGILFLRVNDSPAALADNSGQLQVEIKPAADVDTEG